jgi:hypothetical protein
MVKLNDKQIALLLGKNFGSLAVLDDDGSPEITPVWVDWDGEYVLVNTLQSRMKPRRVEGDARAAQSSARRAPRSTSTSWRRSTSVRRATRVGRAIGG